VYEVDQPDYLDQSDYLDQKDYAEEPEYEDYPSQSGDYPSYPDYPDYTASSCPGTLAACVSSCAPVLQIQQRAYKLCVNECLDRCA